MLGQGGRDRHATVFRGLVSPPSGPGGPGRHWQARALDSEGNRDRVSGVVHRDVALRLRSQPAPTQGNGKGDSPLFSVLPPCLRLPPDHQIPDARASGFIFPIPAKSGFPDFPKSRPSRIGAKIPNIFPIPPNRDRENPGYFPGQIGAGRDGDSGISGSGVR